jgi:hypothetical protein
MADTHNKHAAERLPAVKDVQATSPYPALTAALLSLFTFASCYFRSFIFPHLPLLPGGDGLGFFVAGSRMVAGQLPYRDFFEILPVGTDLVYAALIKCFGFYTWVPGLVVACLAAAVVMLTTLAACRLTRGLAVVLPGLFLAGFVLLGSLDPTHHWFCTVAAIAAMLILFDGVTLPRIFAAGALGGLAACFTQTTGVTLVAGLAAYVVWKAQREDVPAPWRRALLLCGAALGVFAAANGYFVWRAGFRQWLFCVVVYPLRYFTVPAFNNWRVVEYDFQWHPSLGRWISFPFAYATVPLAYLIFILVMRRRRERDQNEPWDQLLLVALTGLAMFLAIAPSPSRLRLSSASPPAMILLAWLVGRPGKVTNTLKAVLGAAAVAIAIAAPLHYQTRWHASLDLPAGRTAFYDPVQYEEYRWLLSRTHPGQYFFGMPPMYLPFHMLNPTAVEGFDTSDYTRPEQVTAGLQALREHSVPMILLRGSLDDPTLSPSDHTGPFRSYMHENYRVTKTFPNGDAVWEKVDRPRVATKQ